MKLSPEALRRGRASPEMFELSSEDKKSDGQRLSVWVEELTVADQAWDFMGARDDCNVVACLSVDGISSIPAPPGFEPLRVEWEGALMFAAEAGLAPNIRPGAEGHAGVSGLNQGGGGKVDRLQRKALRSDLADAAHLSPVPVPHDIPEEELRIAAYFIHESTRIKSTDPASDWIEAVRQLRRARVRGQEFVDLTS